ncbi:MAG: 6-phosphofructokinase, partial [uncultured Rubrobacteraceae bacterium]
EDSGAHEWGRGPRHDGGRAGGGPGGVRAGLGGRGGRGRLLRAPERQHPPRGPSRAVGLRPTGRDDSGHGPLLGVRGRGGGKGEGARHPERRGRGRPGRDWGRRKPLGRPGVAQTRPAHRRRAGHHRQRH